MKKLLFILFVGLLASSCVTTLPLQSNLNDNTLLMSKNKNLKVTYDISSDIKDGLILCEFVQKNGKIQNNTNAFQCPIESALKSIWKNYFESKFNESAREEINVIIKQTNFFLKDQATTSIGVTMVTGNSQSMDEAHSSIEITIIYQGQKYKKTFDIVTNEFQESQIHTNGYYSYTSSYHNPTEQKTRLVENCLNKGIVLFDSYINSILKIE